ncbi:hypothetical protein H6F43_20655 [Leptolyngbya sp. FACHB-36]|uniref:hypothetical protein n=1 Tax=Leptolyngbya sp. FACHB-36 TaxID=2692808 RepID=UPI001681133A|nr:hypothetical protein [Leptolyngbya sp. FACHB-36]MBD2022597.1 hypothetical protein [Leptolyngbya sp. FACHB-36]
MLPQLQLRPISTSHFFMSGDVTIQDGAAIAPGVLLQADPDSRILIKTGACIGIGSVLHAHHGAVEVGEGASIGAEVLLIGQVTIGANACVGAATTIVNSSVEWGGVIPPGSLLGDTSRSASELKATDTVYYPTPEANTPAAPNAIADPAPETPASSDASSDLANKGAGVSVYGQLYVNQMLVKMFPNSRRATPPPEPRSSAEDPWDD